MSERIIELLLLPYECPNDQLMSGKLRVLTITSACSLTILNWFIPHLNNRSSASLLSLLISHVLPRVTFVRDLSKEVIRFGSVRFDPHRMLHPIIFLEFNNADIIIVTSVHSLICAEQIHVC
jgi:hypothetical protein